MEKSLILVYYLLKQCKCGGEMQSQKQVLWQTICGEAELSLSVGNYKTWFEPAELISIDGEKITIAHINPFAKDQFEKKFRSTIIDILLKNGFKSPIIECVTKKKKQVQDDDVIMQISMPESSSQMGGDDSGLNSKYRFENFIVGGCNDFAYSASQAVVKNPGDRYNPLFIYGGVGLGKTHLIQAIGNEIIETHPKYKVLYLTAETFVNDFLDHIKNKKQGFEERYRKVDVLIVDDIQFIADKEKTQEAFFHTFNALHNQNKHIILSSDRQPANIPALSDRLRSRFQMGMIVDIGLPDFETRCAIIEKKTELSNIELPRPTTEFIAENIKTNIRELEGALSYILANCEMRELTPDVETVSALLSNIKAAAPKHITPKQIINKTAEYFDIKPSDILSTSHKNSLARQICMYLFRSELKYSFPRIAKEINRKDHTTAKYGVNKIEREIKLNNEVKVKISEIQEKLYV